MKQKLKDICEGITDGSHNPPSGGSASDFIMISSKNVFDDCITYDEPRFLTEEQFNIENKRTNITSGDILMTIVGTVGRTAVVNSNTRKITLQRSVAVLHPNNKICNSRFLMYSLRSKRKYFESEAHGVAQKGIYLKQLSEIYLNIPEKKRQNNIVQILDNVCDIIMLRKQQLQQLDDLIKARFVEMFGDLRINPRNWKFQSIEELTELITDGEHATPRRVDSGIYLLSARNVLNHTLQLDDVDYINDKEYNRIAKRVIPVEGDVLISCSGTVGRCCTVPAGLQFQMVRSVALLRFKQNIIPKFAEYMVTSDFMQEQINQSKTASSQANLFQGKIAKLKGFSPPIELQEQFASFVQQVDKSKFDKIYRERYKGTNRPGAYVLESGHRPRSVVPDREEGGLSDEWWFF